MQEGVLSDPNDIDETLTSPEGSPSAEAKSAPPTLAGRYVLGDRLGAGGAGAVYRAFDLELERQVAIKILLASATPRPPGHQVARLRREARANALLQHPNVVSIFDVGEDEALFIAMELVDGGSLLEWLREPRSREEVLRAFLGAGEGLLAAHRKGIIHRDFKPSNVLVGLDGRARVADFGLARALAGDSDEDLQVPGSPSRPSVLHDLTRTGALLGTPAYMAPEQFEGGSVDARADQYAYCLSLGEALVGEAAPRGVITADGWSQPDWDPRVWLRGAPVQPQLREAIARGLAKRPEDRLASLEPLLDALRRQLRRRRRLGRLALAMGTAALAGQALLWFASPAIPCRGFAAELEPVWSPSRRQTLAISRTAPGWSEVWRTLDQITESWLAARTQVCEATHRQGTQSEELLDVRMSCLGRWLNGLEVLLALIEERRIEASGRASEALLRLPGPASCREVELTAGPKQLVAEAEQEEVTRIQRKLDALEALYAAGLLEEGLGQARGLEARARTTEHRPTQAQVAGEIARFLQALDRSPEAKTAWSRASHLADAAGDDALRFRAAIALVDLDEPDPARESHVVERAQALALRRGGGPRQRMTLSAALSGWSFRRGDLVACGEYGEEAVALLEQTPGAPLFERLAVKEALAICLERLGARRRATAVLQAALEEARSELGPHHSRVGELQVQLSRALDFSGEQAAAEAEARRGLDTLLRSLGRSPRTARAYQALANAMFRKGDFEASVRFLLEARSIMAEVRGEASHEVGGLESSIGLSYSYLKRYEEADRYHRGAVEKLGGALGPRHPETGAAWGRLGANLSEKGDCDEAISHFRRAKDILTESHPHHARILDQIRGMGACMAQLGRWRELMPIVEDGLKLAKVRDEAPLYAALLDLLAAQTFAALGRTEKARARARAASDHLAGETGPREQRLIEEIAAWRRSSGLGRVEAGRPRTE
ncbi:MAG: serine/threonine-protein kinase, partial [Myxococcota bacterium]